MYLSPTCLITKYITSKTQGTHGNTSLLWQSGSIKATAFPIKKSEVFKIHHYAFLTVTSSTKIASILNS